MSGSRDLTSLAARAEAGLRAIEDILDSDLPDWQRLDEIEEIVKATLRALAAQQQDRPTEG